MLKPTSNCPENVWKAYKKDPSSWGVRNLPKIKKTFESGISSKIDLGKLKAELMEEVKAEVKAELMEEVKAEVKKELKVEALDTN